jgi:hypothetical protein
VISAAAVAVVFAGLSLPDAMARGGGGGGGHGGGGVHFGGGMRGFRGGYGMRGYGGGYGMRGSYSHYRPSMSRGSHSSHTHTATKSASHKYTPPKHAAQKKVAQKHEAQKHAARGHLARPPKTDASTHERHHALQGSQRFGAVKSNLHSKGKAAAKARGKTTGKTASSTSTHKASLHHGDLHHGDWHHGDWHHHGWYGEHRDWHHHGWYGDYIGWHHHWWHHHYYYGYYGDDVDYGDYYGGVRRHVAIQSIRRGLEALESVLDKVVARQGTLEKELKDAQEQIASVRKTIDGAVAKKVENNKAMRELESQLTAKQGAGSELAEAQSKVDAMRALVDRELRRVLALPRHAGTPTAADYAHQIASLSPAQKEKLDKDSRFVQEAGRLEAAVHELIKARQSVCEKDPTYVAARNAAHQGERERLNLDREMGKVTGVGQVSHARELRDVEKMAERARMTIAAGRTALRHLGASTAVAKSK